MSLLKTLVRRFVLKIEPFLPPRRLIVVQGDVLPAQIPIRSIVLVRDGQEDWCIGLQCPCGCGNTIELLIIDEAQPRWDYSVNASGLPSVQPSVWRNSGCRSHFWLRKGRIQWV